MLQAIMKWLVYAALGFLVLVGAFVVALVAWTPEPHETAAPLRPEREIARPAAAEAAPAPIASMSPTEWLEKFEAAGAAAKRVPGMADDDAFALELQLATLGSVLAALSPPMSDAGRVFCANAAQSLSNLVSDVRAGKVEAGRGDLADYRDYRAKCLAANRPKRPLNAASKAR